MVTRLLKCEIQNNGLKTFLEWFFFLLPSSNMSIKHASASPLEAAMLQTAVHAFLVFLFYLFRWGIIPTQSFGLCLIWPPDFQTMTTPGRSGRLL